MKLQAFIPVVQSLTLNRKFIIYSALYGLTTLIVPLAVQFLVNRLALSGIWINIIGFIVITGAGLTLSLVLRYCQVILNEFLQRELFYSELKKWKKNIVEDKRMYFSENFFVLKSFSKAYTAFVEIILTAFFGLLMIVVFHPAFLILPILIGITLYQIHLTTKPAIATSIRESDEKYTLFKKALNDEIANDENAEGYLMARDDHFQFIKKNTIKISILFLVCQIALLGGGTWLVQVNQLSIGQLVSAEIIFSGLMVSLTKLPAALEALYDFETNIYKLTKARGKI